MRVNSPFAKSWVSATDARSLTYMIPKQSLMQKPVVTGWNKPTREYYEVPKARQSKPLSRVKLYGAGVILAIIFGWQGYVGQMAVFMPIV